MARANIALECAVKNDTWDGLSDCQFSSDGSAFASPLALVRMTFKDSGGSVRLTLSSANADEIEITDASGWMFDILPRVLTMAEGAYSWGIETTDDQDVVKTRVVGTIQILQDPV